MKIAKLIELHRQHVATDSLATNFGDGFLLKNNRIYRNVRLGATQAGVEYSDAADQDYASLPFSQLERILKSKRVPFVDNVSVLETLSRRHPELQWDDLSDGLRKNFVFHESCHLVVRNAGGALPATEREAAYRMLLEESFANACELLAVVDAQDAAHRIFYETNSYSALFGDRSNLKRAMDDFGEEVVFQFLWLSYLQSNFLRMPDEKSWQRTIALVQAPPVSAKTLKALSKIAFTLDLNFRTKTTQLHLQLSGLSTPLQKLLDFDFLSLAETDQNRQFLKKLSQQVLS